MESPKINLGESEGFIRGRNVWIIPCSATGFIVMIEVCINGLAWILQIILSRLILGTASTLIERHDSED
jgi:hypothetical protein